MRIQDSMRNCSILNLFVGIFLLLALPSCEKDDQSLVGTRGGEVGKAPYEYDTFVETKCLPLDSLPGAHEDLLMTELYNAKQKLIGNWNSSRMPTKCWQWWSDLQISSSGTLYATNKTSYHSDEGISPPFTSEEGKLRATWKIKNIGQFTIYVIESSGDFNKYNEGESYDINFEFIRDEYLSIPAFYDNNYWKKD